MTTQADTLEAVLALGVTENSEPVSPTTEFPDVAQKIFVALRSDLSHPVTLKATWFATKAEGMAPNRDLGSGSGPGHYPGRFWRNLPAGPQRSALWIGAPYRHSGFQPGDYRVDLTVDGAPWKSLEFKVLPTLAPAGLSGPETPYGLNLALRGLGGRIESVSSEADTLWAGEHLIDGGFAPQGECDACGWKSAEDSLPDSRPEEIVLSFHGRGEALIGSVMLNTATAETVQDPRSVPKHVEVWASTVGPAEGFARLAGARLLPRAAEQWITFPPARAKYVKLRLLTNHGSAHFQLGEVEILEAAMAARSLLADLPKNLALPGLGGAIVRFTSRAEQTPASQLVDGGTDTPGWRSADGYLPQEFVFAFRGDQAALVDRIVLNPKTSHEPASWPRRFTVSTSNESPLDGFEEVGEFTLAAEPRDQAFPVSRRARFVKLRILENHGGSHTSLGEVQLVEGVAEGYRSVLLVSQGETSASRAPADVVAVEEAGIAIESEPNDAPAEADPLEFGRRTKATIDPLGENDHFRLSLPGRTSAAVTFELIGRPNIRTSVTLLDQTGNAVTQLDPAQLTGQQTEFSWTLEPGEHLLRVTEPPVSLVLIWDTSGSMRGSTEDLRLAVEAYLDAVRPSERLKLVRFSSTPPEDAIEDVEVLLPEFTSDRERLKAASRGKFFADGGTPLYEAIAKGMELLGGVRGNRAIVVMTDGRDTGTRVSYPEFWRLLEEKRIRLYTIGLGQELLGYVPQIGSKGGRVLTHAAMATGGRFFFARSSEELKGLYQEIAREVGATSTYYLRPILSSGTGHLAVVATGERIASVSAPSRIELILDASGSMKRKIEGRLMIDIAKEAMERIIKGLPDDIEVALRIYGHRIREGQKGDCQDSELVFPFGRLDKPKLLAHVRGIRALGTTPIAYSLQQVASDFAGAPGSKMVILVTDGKEECKGDPTSAVAQLLEQGVEMRLNIVGFALADTTDKRQMREVAALTDGSFFDAGDAGALAEAIQDALAVPYDVVDSSGKRVAGGAIGSGPIEVPSGVYAVVIQAQGEPIRVPEVRIAPEGSTEVALRKEGQEVGIQVHGP